MRLKRRVEGARTVKQSPAEALARVKRMLSDDAVVEALVEAQRGAPEGADVRAIVPLTQNEFQALAEQMAVAGGPLRNRVYTGLPADGVGVSYEPNALQLWLMGEPTPMRFRSTL